jgi:uroporphyrinogen-III synthase
LTGFTIGLAVDAAATGDSRARSDEVARELRAAGARVERTLVEPHVPLAGSSGPCAVERLLSAVAERRLDAVAFTSSATLDRFRRQLDRPSAPAERAAVLTCTTEDGAQVIEQHLTGRCRVVELAGTTVRVQGRLAVIDGDTEVWLTDRERALLEVLLERPGAVRSKRELLRRVWDGSERDEHVVEVTVARLRQRLGPASAGIETVVRRGYRATVAPDRSPRPLR